MRSGWRWLGSAGLWPWVFEKAQSSPLARPVTGNCACGYRPCGWGTLHMGQTSSWSFPHSSEAAFPSHQGSDNLCISFSSSFVLWSWSFEVYSHHWHKWGRALSLETKENTGQRLWHVLPWAYGIRYWAAQQAAPPTLRSAAGQSPQTETSGVLVWGRWGHRRLLRFESKGYLEAMALWSSLTGELGQELTEVNNCPDGLFFPLDEVIILQDKNTQGWNKSCVKTSKLN